MLLGKTLSDYGNQNNQAKYSKQVKYHFEVLS
jgi:hypothetical protein